jgi:hypothetical protein
MVSSYAGIGIMGNQSGSDRAKDFGWSKVQSEFGSLPYDCVSLDKELKRISTTLIGVRKATPLPNAEWKAYTNALEQKKSDWEKYFALNGCRDVIENIRLKSAALAETKFAIQSEKQVLGESNKNQNLYIGIGAIVILAGLYIILKK